MTTAKKGRKPTTKKRRAGGNQIESALQDYHGAMEVVEPPEGVVLDDDESKLLWKQMTRARAKADWREMDLRLLGDYVDLDKLIRQCEQVIEADGLMIDGAGERKIAHPMINTKMQLMSQQGKLLRGMGLHASQAQPDKRQLEARAKREEKTREIIGDAKDQMNLLATPRH